MLLLLLPTALAADWFYPGAGPEVAVIDDRGRIGEMEVQRTGRLLVGADDPGAFAAQPQVTAVDVLGPGVLLLHLVPGADELAFSRRLHGQTGVRWAHPDLVLPMQVQSLPDDPYLAGQWHLENDGATGWRVDADIDASVAWDLTRGAGQIIAVLDSGTDIDHPDLSVIAGRDFLDDDDDPSPVPGDSSGPHGTATAGLAAALGDNGVGVAGVAYEAQVYAVRIVGGSATLSDMYDAFTGSVDAGATVINNSWGFSNGCDAYALYGTLESAFEYAEEVGRGGLGTAVVFSAGNGSCDNSSDGMLGYETIIGVGASSGDDVLEWYSSYGDGVDLVGPSGNMLTTDIAGADEGYGSYGGDPDYYDWFSGTSASAPVVSGVVALLFAANPRLRADQVLDVLCATATPIDVDDGDYDSTGWSAAYGCGRINAGAAVLAVANSAPDAPVLLSPIDEAPEGRIVLRWSGADADGDTLQWTLRWWTGEEEEAPETATVVELDDEWLDLSGVLVEGDSFRWQVQASDSWGVGEASEVAQVVIVADEEAPPPPAVEGGCMQAGTRAAGGLMAVVAALLAGRRRRGVPGR
jgi:subtilisin family serine protease